MRKLASIQKVLAIDPIEGADAIVRATVLGWQLVVKKDEFRVGDLVIYCEIDSLMPDRPEFEFLRPRAMRIKTARLRGQISQGICFPLNFLPADFPIEEGADCTQALGIIKYEPPIPACLVGQIEGMFPSFIPKTDETRVQLLQDVLNRFAGEKCYITEKLDGSSVTYFIKDGEFGVCSRNLQLKEDDTNSFWKKAISLDIEAKLRTLNGNFALQGEIVGEGIQHNKLKLKGQIVRFFNIFNIDTASYFYFEDFKNTLEKLELPMVPVLSTDYALGNDIGEIVKMATIRSTVLPEVWAEGIVIRPIQERPEFAFTRNLSNGRMSFKAINPEFLIKYGE